MDQIDVFSQIVWDDNFIEGTQNSLSSDSMSVSSDAYAQQHFGLIYSEPSDEQIT